MSLLNVNFDFLFVKLMISSYAMEDVKVYGSTISTFLNRYQNQTRLWLALSRLCVVPRCTQLELA